MLDYRDSNSVKQNQNLLCYHYTIVQTNGLWKTHCKGRAKQRIMQISVALFHNEQEIILLSTLHQEVLIANQTVGSDDFIESRKFLLID